MFHSLKPRYDSALSKESAFVYLGLLNDRNMESGQTFDYVPKRH